MIRHRDSSENEIQLKFSPGGPREQQVGEMQTLLPPPQSGQRAARHPQPAGGTQQMMVLTPRGLDDAPSVIEAVRAQRVVVVNSAWLEDAPGQRLIDFICGGLTAIGGQVHRIDEEIFLFAPASSRISLDAAAPDSPLMDRACEAC
jgi:cell division inhibitor SepF